MSEHDRFIAVKDGRGTRIRSLWKRGQRFYAQLTTVDADGLKKSRRVPLVATTVAEAKEQIVKLKAERITNGNLNFNPKSAAFREIAAKFLDYQTNLKTKSKYTLKGYRANLVHLLRSSLADVPLSALKTFHIQQHIERRLKGSVGPGVINGELVLVRMIIQYAVDSGFLPEFPTGLKITGLPYKPTERRLITSEQIYTICKWLTDNCPRAGKYCCEYIRYLAYSGSRKDEAGKLRWDDVDFTRKTVKITSGDVRPEIRYVHMNQKLEALLLEIYAYRGALADRPVFHNSPYLTFTAAVEACGLSHLFDNIAFHAFRHYFISNCVMAGIDFRTIAEWVGHKDGGVLIGKTYSHLNHQHMEQAAQKVSFK